MSETATSGSIRTDDTNENYDILSNTFIGILNKNAPLKKVNKGNSSSIYD